MTMYPFSHLAVFKIFLLSLILNHLTAGCDFLSFFPVLGWLYYMSHELLYQFVNILRFFFSEKIASSFSLSSSQLQLHWAIWFPHVSYALFFSFFVSVFALVGYFLLISSSSLIGVSLCWVSYKTHPLISQFQILYFSILKWLWFFFIGLNSLLKFSSFHLLWTFFYIFNMLKSFLQVFIF